jgi:hypothetical protein
VGIALTIAKRSSAARWTARLACQSELIISAANAVRTAADSCTVPQLTRRSRQA